PTRRSSDLLRGSGAPESLVGAVRAAVASLDKSLALFHVRTMPQIIAEAMTTTQYETVLLVSMAALAVLLAAVGTYGVMSTVVGQRTNEIGIRMAVGARPREILAMVVRQAFLLVMIGIVVGWGGAAGAAKAIESLLFHVPPFDPVTCAGARFKEQSLLATRRGERPWGRPAWRGAPGSSTLPARPGQA